MSDVRLKGRNVMLFKTGDDGKATAKAFACATSCSISSRLKLEETSDKDTPITGVQEMVGQEWDASTTNLMSDLAAYEELMELHLAGTVITIAIGTISNPNNDGLGGTNTAWALGATGGYFGKAIIESIELTADNGSKATYNAKFKGTSPLKKRK